jgi:hypothetical protein
MKRFLMKMNSCPPCVTERPYSWLAEPASRPSSIKDSNEEGTSAGFIGSIEVSPEIIRPFPKPGPKDLLEYGQSRVLTDTLTRVECN